MRTGALFEGTGALVKGVTNPFVRTGALFMRTGALAESTRALVKRVTNFSESTGALSVRTGALVKRRTFSRYFRLKFVARFGEKCYFASTKEAGYEEKTYRRQLEDA